MLPPVLEIYVVWHPGDAGGSLLAEQIAGHFQGSPYAELMAETVQVYLRSVPWDGPGSMPRPIPWPDQAAASGVRPAGHVAVVPLIGLELCRALQRGDTGWQAYLGEIVAAEQAHPQLVSVQPIRLDGAVTPAIEALFGRRQLVGEPDSLLSNDGEAIDQTRLRELVQALAQWLTGTRLKVFVSHTKRRGTVTGSNPATTETEAVEPLVRSVLDVLRSSRFEKFYDANDLQPHENWDTALTTQAAQCALLALRTDLYATRDWCQREVMLAKTHGRPVKRAAPSCSTTCHACRCGVRRTTGAGRRPTFGAACRAWPTPGCAGCSGCASAMAPEAWRPTTTTPGCRRPPSC
jgi:hypothetical protein